METFGAVVAGALFWLPRIAVVFLVLTAVIWAAAKGVGWFVPHGSDSAPVFEAESAEQNLLLARLFQAEFVQIKGDLASSAGTVNRLLQAWTREFQETTRKKQSSYVGRQVQSAVQAPTASQAKVIPSEIRESVDLDRVSAVVENVKLLSSAINTAKVPDINIASVELGPLLRWLMDVFRPPENKVAIFDENSAALIEGPIVSDGRTVLEFDPSVDQKKRTAREMVDAVAYEILARKLASTDKLASAESKIDFGGWAALRDFVVGTKQMAKLVSQPQPGQVAWNKQVAEAAGKIESAGTAAREWKFIALASFLFERSKDFDNAIRVLDQHAEFARGKKEDEDGREARIAYLRDRRIESSVASALEARKGDGAVFAATTTALARLPSVVAARKLHRLDGAPDRAKVKIAILSGAKPSWFGLDRPPDTLPVEDFLDRYGAELAQVVQALSPSADVVFVPVARSESNDSKSGVVSTSDLLSALNEVASGDAPVILLPFGPFKEATMAQVFLRLMQAGHLVIVPAGNSGKPEDFPMATTALVAESLGLDGRRSGFSSEVKGSLGAVGELPTVDLTEAGPTVTVGIGTSYAAAALAAIAVESVARQPTLKGIALRDALIHAAAQPVDTKHPPIARVVIPR
jgi:hypothetical protein